MVIYNQNDKTYNHFLKVKSNIVYYLLIGVTFTKYKYVHLLAAIQQMIYQEYSLIHHFSY